MDVRTSTLVPHGLPEGRKLAWFIGPEPQPEAPRAVKALAVGVVPWTALLMLVKPERWFPSRRARRAWVVADVAMAGGLVMLAQRWRPRLARGIALALSIDTGLTLAQLLGFNLPHARRTTDRLGAAVGLLAPAIGAAALWGASSAREG